ncbi:hypothetical protein JXM83_01015 [Candidatus Woesearchaeota archaeon]|nr:hypothetical protein [Candidatus Woesearchaeota archaeon]
MPKKFRLFSSKRAVSPLIATVLLIAFAVALGAVVMNWGKGYVQSQAIQVETKSNAQLSCQSDVELSIYILNGRPKVCYEIDGGVTTLRAMLKNDGTGTVEGFSVSVISDTDEVFAQEVDKLVPGGGVTKVELEIDQDDFGIISQVDFTPKILVAGVQKPVLCSKNVLSVDEIYECE